MFRYLNCMSVRAARVSPASVSSIMMTGDSCSTITQTVSSSSSSSTPSAGSDHTMNQSACLSELDYSVDRVDISHFSVIDKTNHDQTVLPSSGGPKHSTPLLQRRQQATSVLTSFISCQDTSFTTTQQEGQLQGEAKI